MSSNQNPSEKDISWQECQQRYRADPQLGLQIIEQFTQELMDNIHDIEQCYQQKNYVNMLKMVHSLHGAACYSCVPNLKKTLESLEISIKNDNITDITKWLKHLPKEAARVLEAYQHHIMTSQHE
jgi:HPt (histidine-containing phosphotransfer) domain-containing protein